MRRILRAALAAIGMLLMCAANAVADEITDDVHCYMVSLQMLQSKQQLIQMSGMFAHGYWLGRLDGRTPTLDIESRVMAELPRMVGDLYRSEAMRCGKVMIARGQAEDAIGKDMQARGRKMMQEENSH